MQLKTCCFGSEEVAVSYRAVNLPTGIPVAFVFLCAVLPSAPSQEARTGDSCLFKANEIELYANCVLRDDRGKPFIAQDYVKKIQFDSYGLAPVFDGDDPRQGWMYVDRNGRVVVTAVPSADNWADEFSEGFVRTVVNKKYGFADRHGKIVIPAKYDGAFPFEHGNAVVCMGCRETCVMSDHPRANSDADCEHHILTGGDWFKINKAGRVVARVSH